MKRGAFPMRGKLIPTVTLLILSQLCAAASPVRACNTALANRILTSLRTSYQNFPEPDFAFVRSRPDARVDGLLNGIRGKGLSVRDVRDFDRDVSFTYSIEQNQGGAWRLCLSMAGPYAVILRLRPRKKLFTAPTSPPEREIVQLVRAAGYTLLDAATLKCPVQVRMPKTVREGSIDRVRYWQALFRDHPQMPWEE
jgi:hypothetical protein